jgi:hypothetical protein
MNRPFGAVDVAANLKGAVPKTATQKILVALAEKGELTQKLYGELYLSLRHNSRVPHFYLCSILLRQNYFLCRKSSKNGSRLPRKASFP